MKGVSNRKHMIDILFPIMLWAILLICSVFAMILGIHFYEKTTNRISSNYETRTALSYLREKIHQNDQCESISISSFDGAEALVFEETYGDLLYRTYIYEYENALWELMVQDGVNASLKDGTKILDVDDFSMKETSSGIFTFSCTNQAGNTVTATVTSVSQSF